LRLLNESGAEKSFGVGGSSAEQPAKKTSEIRHSRARRNAVSDKLGHPWVKIVSMHILGDLASFCQVFFEPTLRRASFVAGLRNLKDAIPQMPPIVSIRTSITLGVRLGTKD